VLIPLVRAVGSSDAVDDAPLRRQLPVAGCERSSRGARRCRLRPRRLRLDTTVHPFETAIGISDIRLSTRYEVEGLESLFSSVHEFGHGLYEHQIAPELDSGLLARGASLGWHESQSLLWENLIGRSRPSGSGSRPTSARSSRPVRLARQRGGLRAGEQVRPDFIRVEADEATYSLHVIVRFELDRRCSRRAGAERSASAWNQRMHDYLGVEVPEDRLGVLQDVHWSQDRSVTSPPTRSATCAPRNSGSASRASCPSCPRKSPAASSRRSVSGCARTCTGTNEVHARRAAGESPRRPDRSRALHQSPAREAGRHLRPSANSVIQARDL